MTVAALRAWRVLKPVLPLVLGVLVIGASVQSFGELADRGFAGALGPALLAASLIAVQVAILGVVWGVVLVHGAPRAVSTALIVRSFVLGWLWRYVPGAPAGPASKLLICVSEGHAGGHVGAAIVSEQLLQLGATLLVPGLTLGFVAGQAAIWATPLATLGAVAVIGLSVHGPAICWLVNRVPQLALPAGGGAFASLPRRHLVALTGLLIVGGVLGGLSFHLIAVMAGDMPTTAIGTSVFVYALASGAGYVIPIVPSGAGIREAVIVAFLEPHVGAGSAVSIAVASRALAVLVDGALGLVTAVAYAGGRLRWRGRPVEGGPIEANSAA